MVMLFMVVMVMGMVEMGMVMLAMMLLIWYICNGPGQHGLGHDGNADVDIW